MMLACAFVIERNARAMGRAGLAHVTSSIRAAKIGGRLGGAGERMRHRFRRGEPRVAELLLAARNADRPVERGPAFGQWFSGRGASDSIPQRHLGFDRAAYLLYHGARSR